MWQYNYTNELYHYGVKGMKWGVRKKIQEYRSNRASRNIEKIQAMRKYNKDYVKSLDNESKIKYARNTKKLNKALAKNKSYNDVAEVTNKYLIAKNKAVKDKNYKQSNEYKKAKVEYGEQMVRTSILGVQGNRRVSELKNRGYSEKTATGRVVAEQILTGVALGAVAATTIIATKDM